MASRVLTTLFAKDAPFATAQPELLCLMLLTERELELLCHLAHDLPDAETADRMCTTTKTIANYKNRIGDKLNLKGHRAVMRFAIQRRELLDQLKPYICGLRMAPLCAEALSHTQAGGIGLANTQKNWGVFTLVLANANAHLCNVMHNTERVSGQKTQSFWPTFTNILNF